MAWVDRLWSRISVRGADECWPWTGGRTAAGYGQLRIGSKIDGTSRAAYTHRLMYELAYGRIPDGKCILHLCDQPECCNPAHLKADSQAANLADMARKRRHGRRTLSDPQVALIRALRENGVPLQEISDIAGCSFRAVRGVLDGETYTYVGEPR